MADEITPGMHVSINPQSDKTRTERIDGIVKDVLTRNPNHPHGVKVLLESGETGRVKKIITTDAEILPPVEDRPKELSIEEILVLGESHFIELKTSAFWSKHLSKEKMAQSDSIELKQHGRRASVFIIAKGIAGFSNADGGDLLIGVKEVKDQDKVEVVGINSEFGKLKDQTIDGYRRALIDDVIKPYLPKFLLHRINDHVRIQFSEIENKLVCWLHIIKSEREVFLKASNRDSFFVRIEASTREIHGEDIVQYCKTRFEN